MWPATLLAVRPYDLLVLFLFFSFLSFVSFSFSKQVSQDELVTHSLKINANFSKGHEHPRGRIGSAW